MLLGTLRSMSYIFGKRSRELRKRLRKLRRKVRQRKRKRRRKMLNSRLLRKKAQLKPSAKRLTITENNIVKRSTKTLWMKP